MKILICIDDTDNLESRGTGELASLLSNDIENNGWGLCKRVTRHQMLVHPDIPYTSHNSAMCFEADINPELLDQLTSFARTFLEQESAPGSDPGLCIVNLEQLKEPKTLMDFGQRAKTEVLIKRDAYYTADRLSIHLSEHGGEGIGVIGALAGCGLRLSGNDGRFKGHFKIETTQPILSVRELIRQTGVDLVKSLDNQILGDDEVVRIGKKVKAVLLDGKANLLVYIPDTGPSENSCWHTCTKQQLRKY
jgi:hypothetical protein